MASDRFELTAFCKWVFSRQHIRAYQAALHSIDRYIEQHFDRLNAPIGEFMVARRIKLYVVIPLTKEFTADTGLFLGATNQDVKKIVDQLTIQVLTKYSKTHAINYVPEGAWVRHINRMQLNRMQQDEYYNE